MTSIIYEGPSILEIFNHHILTINNDDLISITNEYAKYHSDNLFKSFIAGCLAYSAFHLMLQDGKFSQYLPFRVTIPCYDNIFSKSIFSLTSLLLSVYSQISNGIVSTLSTFIQSFMNIWEPLFKTGTDVPMIVQTKLNSEILTGVASHISGMIDIQQQTVSNSLKTFELYIDSKVNNYLSQMTKTIDINHGKIQHQIKAFEELQLSQDITNDIKKNIMDDVAKEINDAFESSINSSTDYINNSQNCNDTNKNFKKLMCEIKNKTRENQCEKFIELKLIELRKDVNNSILGLEHRIEILYNNLKDQKHEKRFKNDPKNDYSEYQFVDNLSQKSDNGWLFKRNNIDNCATKHEAYKSNDASETSELYGLYTPTTSTDRGFERKTRRKVGPQRKRK
jgi:hypothetical protein